MRKQTGTIVDDFVVRLDNCFVAFVHFACSSTRTRGVECDLGMLVRSPLRFASAIGQLTANFTEISAPAPPSACVLMPPWARSPDKTRLIACSVPVVSATATDVIPLCNVSSSVVMF